MKRLILLLCLIIFFDKHDVNSCTNFIVTKGASSDGSVFITYAADAGGFMEPLYFNQATDYPAGSLLEVYDWDSGKYLGKIKQALHTYKVIGNINEHQLAIGETTFGGLDSLKDSTGIIDYGSLIRITLQRAKTAREAINLIDELTKEYGYYSSGESFSIADKNEAWIMELHPKGVGKKGIVWVAQRIPDGYIAAHANQSRIRNFKLNDKENTLYSTDVISYAKEKGIYKEYNGQFSFADTYNPLDPGGVLYCEGRVWRFYSLAAPEAKLSEDYFRAVQGAEPYPLYIKPANKIKVNDLKEWMRDHFEGTDFDMTKGLAAGPYNCPYRWKSLEWKLEGDTTTTYGWERPIGTQQTAFSFIAQLRNTLPNEIGGVFWYGVDAASTTCYIPIYLAMKSVPSPFKDGSIAEFDFNSGFWIFNLVANKAYEKWRFIYNDDIKPIQQSFENKFLAIQPAIEKAALELYNTDKETSLLYLSDYSITQSEIVVERWKKLWRDITVKYNDGYINDINKNNGRSPKSAGYDKEFLKQVVKERPDYYQVKWRDKNPN